MQHHTSPLPGLTVKVTISANVIHSLTHIPQPISEGIIRRPVETASVIFDHHIQRLSII